MDGRKEDEERKEGRQENEERKEGRKENGERKEGRKEDQCFFWRRTLVLILIDTCYWYPNNPPLSPSGIFSLLASGKEETMLLQMLHHLRLQNRRSLLQFVGDLPEQCYGRRTERLSFCPCCNLQRRWNAEFDYN